VRYDVIGKGPTVLSSHDNLQEAAEAAKAAAFQGSTIIEVVDHQTERVIFRARSGEWRWLTSSMRVKEIKR
jgi:hypothetical protein